MADFIQVAYSQRGNVISSVMVPPNANGGDTFAVKLKGKPKSEAQSFELSPYEVGQTLSLSRASFTPVVLELSESRFKDCNEYTIQIFTGLTGSLIYEKDFSFDGELFVVRKNAAMDAFLTSQTIVVLSSESAIEMVLTITAPFSLRVADLPVPEQNCQ